MTETGEATGAMIRPMNGLATAGAKQESFSAVYARHFPDVFRYCLVLTRDAEDAEDAASEVFERGLKAWRAGRTPAGEPLPWLLLVARRIVIDRILRWLPLRDTPGAERETEGSETDRVEFWLWFDRLATVLTPRQREVLLLRYAYDLTNAQIGRILGISEPGVRSLASRAIAALHTNPELIR